MLSVFGGTGVLGFSGCRARLSIRLGHVVRMLCLAACEPTYAPFLIGLRMYGFRV